MVWSSKEEELKLEEVGRSSWRESEEDELDRLRVQGEILLVASLIESKRVTVR